MIYKIADDLNIHRANNLYKLGTSKILFLNRWYPETCNKYE